MQYTVKINEKKRTITVTLSDGTSGTAKCCPTDRFDIVVGTELALERAKVAQKNKNALKTPSVMELVRALEKALPKGEMVVVGNGDKLTNTQKAWLRSLAGGCDCKCHEVDEDEIYEHGYDEGYDKGYADAEAEYDEADDVNVDALRSIRDILADVGII